MNEKFLLFKSLYILELLKTSLKSDKIGLVHKIGRQIRFRFDDYIINYQRIFEDLRIAHAFSIKFNQLSHTKPGSVVSRGWMSHRF